MAQAGQESRQLESIRSCLKHALRWGEQRLLLSRCCGNPWRLLCPANAATIPLGKSHRCPTSRQPGGWRPGSQLTITSSLGSLQARSSALLATRTQPSVLQLIRSLLWPGCLRMNNCTTHYMLLYLSIDPCAWKLPSFELMPFKICKGSQHQEEKRGLWSQRWWSGR